VFYKISGAKRNKKMYSEIFRSEEKQTKAFNNFSGTRGTNTGFPKLFRSDEKRSQAFQSLSRPKRNK